MKQILVVIEHISNVKSMLQKAVKFAPQQITVVCFTSSPQSNNSTKITADIEKLINDTCETDILFDAATTTAAKSEYLNSLQAKSQYDLTLLYRPHIKDAELDFSLVKASLRSQMESPILLCGDNKWKGQTKLLATVDILNESEDQQLLNDKVLDTSKDLSEPLAADINVLTVIPISRFKKELDITEPHAVLAQQGAETKSNLDKMISQTNKLSDYTSHVSAGSVSSEITSVASKVKASIVVMGSVGRTGLKGLVIGNTAEKILKRLTVDTIIVNKQSNV
ncbi:universal stress protein [Paraglaciecola sp.]|uniref:universal stress protein n=1 Tax=Paraglaciecola sp. TaxID=1920173 RepID=UPI003EF8BF95